MTYELIEAGQDTTVTFIHEDPRQASREAEDSDDDNPVLVALKAMAESLANE